MASYSPVTAPIVNKTSFKDMLAEEANFTPSHQPRYAKFADTIEGGLTSNPHNLQEEVAVPTKPTYQSHPEEIELHAVTHEFRKMWEPKISKLKDGYTLSAGLIFWSWLKDIHVHVQDSRLNQRVAMQLVKDFTAKLACDEVEFYMGMVAEEDQSFEGLKNP